MAKSPVLSLPKDEPIVIDNPEFAFDLLNDEGLGQIPTGGTEVVTRDCSALSQIIVFDSKGGSGTEFQASDLEPGTVVSIVLHKDETPSNDPGDGVTVTAVSNRLTVSMPPGTKVVADTQRRTKFRIKTPKPKRGIHSVVFTPKGATHTTTFKLDKNGRHIIFLVPGSPRSFVDLTLEIAPAARAAAVRRRR